MTVAELVAALQEMPQDIDVYIEPYGDDEFRLGSASARTLQVRYKASNELGYMSIRVYGAVLKGLKFEIL